MERSEAQRIEMCVRDMRKRRANFLGLKPEASMGRDWLESGAPILYELA